MQYILTEEEYEALVEAKVNRAKAAQDKLRQLNFNEDIANVTMRYIDRIGDTCDVDPAEKICEEFYAASMSEFKKYYPRAQ